MEFTEPAAPPSPARRAVDAPISPAFVSPLWPVQVAGNGVVTYVDQLAHRLRDMGCRPLILPHFVGDGPRPDIPILDLRSRVLTRSPLARAVDRLYRTIDPIGAHSAMTVRALADAIREGTAKHGTQVVEIEESFGWAAALRRRVSIPVVVRLHGPWFLNGVALGAVQDAAFRRRVAVERRGILAAHGVSAPSQNVLDLTRDYYGIGLEDAVVIPCPCPVIPPERRWRLDEADPDIVLFVGRFDRHKGGDVMIDAFAHLAETHPRARLRFVGHDHFGIVLEDGRKVGLMEYVAARAPHAGDRIEYLGQQPASRIEEFRRRALVTVVPSRYDNNPNTVLEAAALGAPLVASRVGGIPEIVADGESALLPPPERSRELASAIGRLLDDPSLAARLGAAAADRAARVFHPDRVADLTLEFYRRVLERYAAPRGR